LGYRRGKLGNTIDRRKYDRIKTRDFEGEYQLPGDRTVYRGKVIDVSTGGACFLGDSIVDKGKSLFVKFLFNKKHIVLTTNVVRVTGREVAIEFNKHDDKLDDFAEIFNSEYPLLYRLSSRKETEKIGRFESETGSDSLESILDIL